MGQQHPWASSQVVRVGTVLLVLLAVLAGGPVAAAAPDEDPPADEPQVVVVPEATTGDEPPMDVVDEPLGVEVPPPVHAGGEAATGAEVGGADVSGAACAGNSGRSVSGSIRGSNGRTVNVLIGFVLLDALGRGIGMDGCPKGGYADSRGLNTSTPPQGSPGSSATSWSFGNIPANAVTFWLEVYPEQPGGQTNWTYYGGVLVRDQPIGSGRSGVHLTLPAACGHGGSTGTITVQAFVDGQRRGISEVAAFPSTSLGGWGITTPSSRPSTVVLPSLIPNLRYHVLTRVPSAPAPNQANNYDVPVRPCANTDVYVVWGSTRYRDVHVNNPFYDDIEWMATNGITTGFGGGLFKPLSVVTRQAMAAFMYRLAGEPAFTPPAVRSFSDVAADNPFLAEIEWLAEEGVSTGYEDGTFRPFGHVTRGAMSAFMYRLAGEPTFEPPATASFSDVALDFAFFAQIEWMAHTGITTGYSDGSFRPGAGVSRQAMSAFMHRLDELLAS